MIHEIIAIVKKYRIAFLGEWTHASYPQKLWLSCSGPVALGRY